MISLIALRSLKVEKLFAFMLHACPSVYSDVYFCFFLLLLSRIPVWITKKKKMTKLSEEKTTTTTTNRNIYNIEFKACLLKSETLPKLQS